MATLKTSIKDIIIDEDEWKQRSSTLPCMGEFRDDLRTGHAGIEKDLKSNVKILKEIQECSFEHGNGMKRIVESIEKVREKIPKAQTRVKQRLEELGLLYDQVVTKVESYGKLLNKDSMEVDGAVMQETNQMEIQHNQERLREHYDKMSLELTAIEKQMNGLHNQLKELRKKEMMTIEIDLDTLLNNQRRIFSNYVSIADQVITNAEIQEMKLSWEDATIDVEFANFQKSKPVQRMYTNLETIHSALKEYQNIYSHDKKILSELIMMTDAIKRLHNQLTLFHQSPITQYAKDLEKGLAFNEKLSKIQEENQKRREFQSQLILMLAEENKRRDKFLEDIDNSESDAEKLKQCLIPGRYPKNIEPTTQQQYDMNMSMGSSMDMSMTEQLDDILSNPDRIDYERKIQSLLQTNAKLSEELSSLQREQQSFTQTCALFQKHIKLITKEKQGMKDEIHKLSTQLNYVNLEHKQLLSNFEPLLAENKKYKEEQESMILQNQLMMKEYQAFLREYDDMKKQNNRLSEKLQRIQMALSKKSKFS